MADKTYTVKPYVEHIPDAYTETEAAEGASWELGAGFYDFGFEVNGVKVPLRQFKGGAIDKLFNLAEAAKEKKAASDTAETPEESAE